MAVPSKQEILDQVNEAIFSRISGRVVASYSVAGMNLQYITLSELMELRGKMQGEISSARSTRNYAAFRRPS